MKKMLFIFIFMVFLSSLFSHHIGIRTGFSFQDGGFALVEDKFSGGVLFLGANGMYSFSFENDDSLDVGIDLGVNFLGIPFNHTVKNFAFNNPLWAFNIRTGVSFYCNLVDFFGFNIKTGLSILNKWTNENNATAYLMGFGGYAEGAIHFLIGPVLLETGVGIELYSKGLILAEENSKMSFSFLDAPIFANLSYKF